MLIIVVDTIDSVGLALTDIPDWVVLSFGIACLVVFYAGLFIEHFEAGPAPPARPDRPLDRILDDADQAAAAEARLAAAIAEADAIIAEQSGRAYERGRYRSD
jgi:hypothetical protein